MVLNSTPALTGTAVSGWSNASKKWVITATSSTSKKLYAQFTANELIFGNQEIEKTYSTSSQTANITEATNGTGSYTYEEVSETNSSSESTNYISLSGTTLTIAANTPAGTYTYVIKATDDNSNVTANATYTITVNKANSSLSVSPSNKVLTYGTDDVAIITKTGDGTLSCETSDASGYL